MSIKRLRRLRKKTFFIFNALLFFTLLLISQLTFAKELLKIEITGITNDALQNVQERLGVEKKLLFKQSSSIKLSDTDVKTFFQQAPDNIRKAIEPYGYFKSTIDAKLTQQNATWTAHFFINPGPALPITQIDLTVTGPGKNDPEIQKFIHTFPLKNGQILKTPEYEKAKDSLFQVANNQGYLNAVLEKKEIRINLKQYTAIIILHLNTGSRYYFGPVTFAKSPFADEFLRRFLSFHENEPFSSQKLLKFQQDLNNSHYFQQVIVNPEFKKAQNLKIPITVEVTAPKSKKYNIGAGYGTFTGPRVTLGVDWQRVTDTGQHFTTQMKFSSVLSGIAAKYFIPGNHPLTEQYTLGANIQKFKPQNGNSFSEALSAGYVKTVREWQFSPSLNFLNEEFSSLDQPGRKSHLLYPSLTISRISADNIINPQFGSAVSWTVQGTSEHLLSTTSFAQTEIKGKAIFSPTSSSRVILRGDLGFTVVNNLDQLPLTLDFFAGGIGSVRGFSYSSIGPGRYLKVASAEYQHKIIGDWSAAVFYDVGTASNDFDHSLSRGAGIGVIYRSAVGPIQVYLARAESKKNKPFHIEFVLGPDF